jgi:integrase
MASLHQDERTGNWILAFRWAGRQHRRSCATARNGEAQAIKARVEDTIRLLKQGRIDIPTGADPGVWIMSDGKLDRKPGNNGNGPVTVASVCDAYFEDQVDKADTTLVGEKIHIKHLKRLLRADARFSSLTLQKMQTYINRRTKEDNRFGAKVSGKTVKKELTTFMQIWDWARQRGYVDGPCPIKDPGRPRKWAVKIPKPDETERFMTWAEIKRRIARGGLSAAQEKELWKYLFLDETEVRELLAHVRNRATHPFIYPMFGLVSFTGMRRSEMCRSRIDDFNLDDNLVVVRERKRRKDRASTTRDVPLNPILKQIMQSWFTEHPGGQFAVVPPLAIPRRKARDDFDMLTTEEAHHHFKQTLTGSKWEVVRGFHVLRHSFGAICTRAGIPMNVIAKWMGHTTDEMMRLYQHLFPQDEQKWMAKFPI